MLRYVAAMDASLYGNGANTIEFSPGHPKISVVCLILLSSSNSEKPPMISAAVVSSGSVKAGGAILCEKGKRNVNDHSS